MLQVCGGWLYMLSSILIGVVSTPQLDASTLLTEHACLMSQYQ